MITADTLRELFHFNPDSGLFTAKVRRGNCVHIGDVAGHVNSKGYRVIKVKGNAYKAHRLVFLYIKGHWHIDGESVYLGIYKTAEEAYKVYLDAKRLVNKGCTI